MLEMIPEGHPLQGVRLKLERAEEHLVTLDYQIIGFLEREPYQVSYQRKSDGSEHVYRVHINESPPLEFGILIGDCLQNMRTALDHLVWQLAILSGKRAAPTRQTGFPVCDTIEAFRAKGTKNKVADLTKEYRAGIERLQPFQVGALRGSIGCGTLTNSPALTGIKSCTSSALSITPSTWPLATGTSTATFG